MEFAGPRTPVLNQTEWAIARKRALASKDPICAVCQGDIDVTMPMVDENGNRNPLAPEVDHIVPKSRGGDLYELENLQLTHMRCNRKKGAKMASDYVDSRVDNPVPLSNNW